MGMVNLILIASPLNLSSWLAVIDRVTVINDTGRIHPKSRHPGKR